ncbi:hypothetical protein GpartN1_g3003.t1 [Galdieria partita]|uniref:Glycosyl hydrolase family 13 catalytic domain-containing protein n=1 Tax=Galdieria partita TaxID=83374 RepID=A0A9C7UQ54_9RHOD|nr:hypothetical protein GpartN1_g3003.t1 [Galdieria partita]
MKSFSGQNNNSSFLLAFGSSSWSHSENGHLTMHTTHIHSSKYFKVLVHVVVWGLLLGLVYWFWNTYFNRTSNGRNAAGGLPIGAATGAVKHDCRDPLYRDPTGPIPRGSQFVVRLRSAAGELTAAQVIFYNSGRQQEQLISMNLTNGNAKYDWWESTLSAGPIEGVLFYAFRCVWKGGEFFYVYQNKPFGVGTAKTDFGPWESRWSLAVYSPEFQTPNWVKDAVAFYHIFPDRFRNGNLSNDPNNQTTFCYGRRIFQHQEWNELPYDPSIPNSPFQYAYENQYYGGDLKGILDKLDYLIDLGVDVIYLMPIFQSPSCHGYDTSSWEDVEERLGDNALFENLAQVIHSKGMHILLDGVFGTSSSDSKYFDRFRRYYPPTRGACAFPDSPYHSWYQFIPSKDGPCYDHLWYESWWSVYENLPALVTYRREVQDFFFRANDSIAKRWCRIADGFRLDSPQQISHEYWSGFRTAVKQVKSDAFIVGEAWHWTGDYINHGFEWDSTTNYQLMTYVLSFWRDSQYLDNDHIWGQNDPLSPMSPSQFIYTIEQLSDLYAPEAWYSMLNMLSSHDTSRAVFVLDHQAQKNDPSIFHEDYDWSDALARLRGAFSLLMSLAGVPMIYYGDEVGLVGPQNLGVTQLWEDDPYCRLSFPWLDASGTPWAKHLRTEQGQNITRSHVQLLLKARREIRALRTGSIQPLVMDDSRGILVLLRGDPRTTDIAIVAINRGREGWKKRQQVRINIRSINLPEGLGFYDFMGQVKERVVSNPQDGYIRFNLEPWETCILIPEDKNAWRKALERRPPALTGLQAIVDRNMHRPNTTVILSWDPVAPHADGTERKVIYVVSRSLLSSRGFEVVGETWDTQWKDIVDSFLAGEETQPRPLVPGTIGDTSNEAPSSEESNSHNQSQPWPSDQEQGYPGILFPRKWIPSHARIRLDSLDKNDMVSYSKVESGQDISIGQSLLFHVRHWIRRDANSESNNSGLGTERTIYYMVEAMDTETKLLGDDTANPLSVKVPFISRNDRQYSQLTKNLRVSTLPWLLGGVMVLSLLLWTIIHKSLPRRRVTHSEEITPLIQS